MGLVVDRGQKHVLGSPIHVLLLNIGAEVHDRRTAHHLRPAAIRVFRGCGSRVVRGLCGGEWITVG
jgi:hypothetical protein